MRVLLLHTDHIAYEALKAIKNLAEEGLPLKGRLEEAVVAFVAVERSEEGKEDAGAESLAEEIASYADKVESRRVMIYPYAHLSSDLAGPQTAKAVLQKAEGLLRERIEEVHRAPFGWYKAFDLRCKGHPLSELSREIRPGEGKEEVSAALQAEKRATSELYVFGMDGSMTPAEGFDFSGSEGLGRFYAYDHAKDRTAKGLVPPHIALMQQHELADYEPASDSGHFRYYPRGRMVKALLEEMVTRKVLAYGGMEVETPIAYDYNHPALKKYLDRFPARQYTIQTPEKKVFLRFAACFGQFLMSHDATLSYRHLPLRLYELTRYSFRVEQHGELSGLRRLRAFTMPDCHALCADMDQAKEEMMRRLDLTMDVLRTSGFEVPGGLELALRVTRPFLDENRDFVRRLVETWGKPALIEVWEEQFFYFVFKYEVNFIDSLGKAATLSTDQFDVENAANYDIAYFDERGEQRRPVILHLSPSGAIERLIYALLERESQRETPSLPFWLSPTQLRFIPINDQYVDVCERLANEVGFRSDVDDRDLSLGRKVRSAGREWIPLVVVYGQKEAASGVLPVRLRDGSMRELDPAGLRSLMSDLQGDLPYRPLPLPMRLSRRVSFRGGVE